MYIHSPTNEAQVLEVIRAALDRETPLALSGHGTKAQLGHPVEAGHMLSFAQMSGIVSYEPDELMITVLPGTPLEVVEETLAETGQRLAFEPPHVEHLLGADGAGSIGGLVSCNLSGPRRFKAGAVRDFVLAVRAVSGFGDAFKAGGKVMKNVTGYDLPKLVTGAFGTLAALTEITLKVLPIPEAEVSFMLEGVPLHQSVPLLRQLAGDACEPTGLAAWGDRALVRFEGPKRALEDRINSLKGSLPGHYVLLDDEASQAAWRDVRDGTIIQAKTLWRLSVPPTHALMQNGIEMIDGAGGTVWTSAAPNAALDGAAMRARGQEGPFLSPMPAALRMLHDRIKAQFDPQGILNPGRMFGDSHER